MGCLIVDDNLQFLDTARALLEGQGMNIVGVASTSAEAVALAADLKPDLVLVDIDLGEENGFDLARTLVHAREPMTVILISAYPEKDLRELIQASPAAGFLPKAVLSRQAIDDLLGVG
jgi:two-component system, NarL family, nitrate/nitrite response regulator NarL